jgi:hypothetical protein
MRIDFHGLAFETPFVAFHLWSPWRAAELEHRLFEAVRAVARAEPENLPDEWRLQVRDARIYRAAVQAVSRVLKGWQEDADPGNERRTWRWLLEGDTDADGYDHTGEPISLWGFLRLGLERGGLAEADKGEEIDLQGFSMRILGEAAKPPAQD